MGGKSYLHSYASLIAQADCGAGHKFAGNVYVCLPSGACILYGRVTPTEVESIVKQTILQGKVIGCVQRSTKGLCPELALTLFDREMLRGGVGLSRGESILSW